MLICQRYLLLAAWITLQFLYQKTLQERDAKAARDTRIKNTQAERASRTPEQQAARDAKAKNLKITEEDLDAVENESLLTDVDGKYDADDIKELEAKITELLAKKWNYSHHFC